MLGAIKIISGSSSRCQETGAGAGGGMWRREAEGGLRLSKQFRLGWIGFSWHWSRGRGLDTAEMLRTRFTASFLRQLYIWSLENIPFLAKTVRGVESGEQCVHRLWSCKYVVQITWEGEGRRGATTSDSSYMMGLITLAYWRHPTLDTRVTWHYTRVIPLVNGHSPTHCYPGQ